MSSDGSSSDFGVYQCLLFLFTQLGYLAVAPSMLSTTFFEPSSSFCDTFLISSSLNASSVFTLSSSPRMLTLLFCFGSSAVISFCLYFTAEVLPGSRYLNIAMMGLGKLVLGFLPFLLSNRIGRRPILLVSVGLACWTLIIVWLFFNLSKHWLTAALSLFITAAIDPNWKIIHLLSMELFPTPVCNMSCALCNVIACLGSLSVPLVQFLRSLNGVFPFWLFGIFLTIQWLISFFFLPEKTTTLVDKDPLQRLSSLFMCMRGDDYHWLTKQPEFAVRATDTEGNERTISFGRTLIGDFGDKRFDMIVGMSITQCTRIDLKKDIWERSDDEKYQILSTFMRIASVKFCLNIRHWTWKRKERTSKGRAKTIFDQPINKL